MERKLASVQRIAEVKPIPEADAIEAVRVNGWWVVAKKGEFQVDSLVVFCEIDSWIPTELAPFLSKGKEPREYKGVKGERLRTVKLRGQISQGLVLPTTLVSESTKSGDSICFYNEGDDVTEILGITKWEDPEYAGKNTEARGNFPAFLVKTDQERVQNLGNGKLSNNDRRAMTHKDMARCEVGDSKLEVLGRTSKLSAYAGQSFEATIKFDGSSLTAYVNGDDQGVCSRNVDLKDVEGNAFWSIAKEHSLHEKLRSTGRNLAIQGELCAPNIQSNHNKERKPAFYCFSIYDIDAREYLLPAERRNLCHELGIPHVNVLDSNFILDHTVDELLEYAEGPGSNPGVQREGVVLKSNDSQFSFKVVANSYLIKEK